MRHARRALGSVAAATLATLLLAAPASAQAKAPADSVVLRFGWRDGIEADVQYTQFIDRQGDSDTPTHIEIEGVYTMHVHDHAQGLLIEHLEPVASRFLSSPTLPPADPRRIVYSSIGYPTADWVVSKDGEKLVQIQGLQALNESIAQSVQRAAPGADLDQVIGTLANPDALFNAGRERWSNMVGDWIGSTLRPGEFGTGEGTEANPVIPSLEVPYRFQFKLDSLEACAAPGGKCARVDITQFYDPTALNKTMNDALARMGLSEMSFDGLAQESHVILLTDPATLLPYQMDMTKGVEGILVMNGQRRIFKRTDGITMDFTYTKR
jgi:hypothetical protein